MSNHDPYSDHFSIRVCFGNPFIFHQPRAEALKLLNGVWQKAATEIDLTGIRGRFHRLRNRAQGFCSHGRGRSFQGMCLQPQASGIRIINACAQILQLAGCILAKAIQNLPSQFPVSHQPQQQRIFVEDCNRRCFCFLGN